MKIERWEGSSAPTTEKLETILRDEGLDPYRWVDASRMKLRVGQSEFVLSPGDRLDLPAQTRHSARLSGMRERAGCLFSGVL